MVFESLSQLTYRKLDTTPPAFHIEICIILLALPLVFQPPPPPNNYRAVPWLVKIARRDIFSSGISHWVLHSSLYCWHLTGPWLSKTEVSQSWGTLSFARKGESKRRNDGIAKHVLRDWSRIPAECNGNIARCNCFLRGIKIKKSISPEPDEARNVHIIFVFQSHIEKFTIV